MAWHTFREATTLTGRSRRSIYRDIASGRISSDLGRDGQRRFETTELMRAYGPLLPLAQEESAKVAQVVTPYDMTVVLDELQALRIEVKELKETLLRLEHRPADALAEPTPEVATNTPESSTSTKTGSTALKRATTWGSLLEALGGNSKPV